MTLWINPVTYTLFKDEEEAMKWCKYWGLLSEKAAKQKNFRYRGQNMDEACELVGYADQVTAVIQVGEQLHCIHPSYLKEQQAGRVVVKIDGDGEESKSEDVSKDESSGGQISGQAEKFEEIFAEKVAEEDGLEKVKKAEKVEKVDKADNAGKVEKPQKKEKKAALSLPEGKVAVEAVLQAFAMVPNHFTEEDDEVVIFEQVLIQIESDAGRETIPLEAAWSSYSNTLKKFDLQIGDHLKFEAKIAQKKLTKHPIKYKLNNAAKVTKI
ncbi:MAG TPA: hypothetical protein VGE40_05785 [Bacilli bacterium]